MTMTVTTTATMAVNLTDIVSTWPRDSLPELPYFRANRYDNHLDSTTKETTKIETSPHLPPLDVPVWVDSIDSSAICFAISNNLGDPLFSVFSIIYSVFKGTCKANVSLNIKTDEYDRDYLVILITGTKSQNKNMAKYLMQCNYQLAHTLPVDVLSLVVLTMG